MVQRNAVIWIMPTLSVTRNRGTKRSAISRYSSSEAGYVSEGHHMSISSWVGSVWSLRGVEGPVIGQVRLVDGEYLTMAVVGMGDEAPQGVEILPRTRGEGRLARISSADLLARWKRMGGAPSEVRLA